MVNFLFRDLGPLPTTVRGHPVRLTRAKDEVDLIGRAKGDPEKLALAVRLRAETAVTVQWIAERLQMGAPGYLNHLLYRERNENDV